MLCEHELPGTARHDPLAYLQNRTVDWLDHQLAARELLDLDAATTHLSSSTSTRAARIQDQERLAPILTGSIAFTRHIDEAAACMYALQHEVLAGAGHPGAGRRPRGVSLMKRSPATQADTPAPPLLLRHLPLDRRDARWRSLASVN